MTCALEFKHVSKAFGTNKVLNDVCFDVRQGEVHALLGENGAGKSTLMKILGGIYRRDSGEILIDGTPRALAGVAEATAAGIRIIHQEIVLVPGRTVADNIFLGREITDKLGFVDGKKMRAEAQKIIDGFGLNISAGTMVGKLTIGMQQLVEIMKAVSTDAKIIAMDEPTSSLSKHEVQILFELIKKLKAKGVSIIYISHKIDELYQIADRITVLRDGMSIKTVPMQEINSDELVSMMVGRVIDQYYIKTENKILGKALEVKDLSHKKYFRNVSFYTQFGEIVGFSGLIGAGRTEVMKTLFGIFPKESGTVTLDGKPLNITQPGDALDAGIAYIPENRREEGLILGNSVDFNMTLAVLKELIRGIKKDKAREKELINNYVDKFAIKITSPNQLAGKLSGGNQQKVVLAKWLAANPRVLILDEPTRGIDVGSKSEIYGIINDLAKAGCSIIIVSSELAEIINMCDRVYVMCGGEITGELPRSEFSQEAIMKYAAKGNSAPAEGDQEVTE